MIALGVWSVTPPDNAPPPLSISPGADPEKSGRGFTNEDQVKIIKLENVIGKK